MGLEDDVVRKRYENRKLAIQLAAPVIALSVIMGGAVALLNGPDFKEQCIEADGTWNYQSRYDDNGYEIKYESCVMPGGTVTEPE